VQLNSQPAEAHYNLAHAHAEMGKIDDAISCYREAIKLKPELIDAHINLGVLLQKKGELNQALICHQTALKLDSTCFDAYNNLGLTLRALGHTSQAITCLGKALQVNPGCVDALINIGQIYQECGEMQKAEKAFTRALSIQPDSIKAYYYLTGLNAQIDCNIAIERLETLPGKITLSIEHNILLHYTLGRLYAGTGNYGKAFGHYQLANELDQKVAAEKFQFKDVERQISLLMNAFDSEFFNRRKHFGISSQLPVFIVGMPRSGTTLVEQIISSHPLVFGAGELSELKQIEEALHSGKGLEMFARLLTSLDKTISTDLAGQYLTRIRSFSKDALQVTDKYPHNFMRLWLIALLFPMAKIIHCRRDPVDTCLSCYFTKFSHGHSYKNDLTNLGSYYRLYQRLMDHWHRVLPFEILDVHYEDLIENQYEISRRVIEFCGLPWDNCCLEFYKNDRPVLTASVSQVRRKIYKTSSGRWKRYEKYLGELLDALQ